jgi:hypothetical protein
MSGIIGGGATTVLSAGSGSIHVRSIADGVRGRAAAGPATVRAGWTAELSFDAMPVAVGDAVGIGGGNVFPARRAAAGGAAEPAGRSGSWTPVGGALRTPARRGGSGGNRRPHA